MSLHAIVRALGGDLYDGGRRASIPAPGHSRRDRSVSLLWSNGRLIVHSFGEADWREVRDHLRALRLIAPTEGALAEPAPRSRLAPEPRVAVASRLWAEARPIRGTLAERHLRLRHIHRALPPALRFHPAVPLAVYAGGHAAKPALVAAISEPSSRLTAVEITYLEPSGRRAQSLRLSRKTIGVVPRGSAVRLDEAARRLVVAEGVATALSAAEQFQAPAWALLGAGNLAAWSPPPGVRAVLIAGDRGRPGERAAAALCARLRGLGVVCQVRLPPSPFGDWNEAALAKGEGEGGRGRA
jgi:putative DNA primase/helicase